jgi:hypothetical protein
MLGAHLLTQTDRELIRAHEARLAHARTQAGATLLPVGGPGRVVHSVGSHAPAVGNGGRPTRASEATDLAPVSFLLHRSRPVVGVSASVAEPLAAHTAMRNSHGSNATQHAPAPPQQAIRRLSPSLSRPPEPLHGDVKAAATPSTATPAASANHSLVSE